MSNILEDMRKEAAEEAARKMAQEVAQRAEARVLRWVAKGLSLEDIAEGEDMTIEQVRAIASIKKE